MNDQNHGRVRTPSPADHIALRTLIKYMSSVYGIPYKSICDGTRFNESAVKNYVNDKATRHRVAVEVFNVFVQRCADLIYKNRPINDHDYIVCVKKHLFGEKWLESVGIKQDIRALDGAVANWLDVREDEIEEVERRYAGLWRVLRPSSTNSPRNEKSLQLFNCSLLNVRPRKLSHGKLCDFRWYYHSRDDELGEYSLIEGVVIPQFDRIEFLGRMSARHRVLSLMSWRSGSNLDLRSHAEVSYGLTLSINMVGGPVSARVRAFFVSGSNEQWAERFDDLRREELQMIGNRRIESVRSIIPTKQLDRTLHFFAEDRPIVGFAPASDDLS